MTHANRKRRSSQVASNNSGAWPAGFFAGCRNGAWTGRDVENCGGWEQGHIVMQLPADVPTRCWAGGLSVCGLQKGAERVDRWRREFWRAEHCAAPHGSQSVSGGRRKSFCPGDAQLTSCGLCEASTGPCRVQDDGCCAVLCGAVRCCVSFDCVPRSTGSRYGSRSFRIMAFAPTTTLLFTSSRPRLGHWDSIHRAALRCQISPWPLPSAPLARGRAPMAAST
jgi:hypothetical protein